MDTTRQYGTPMVFRRNFDRILLLAVGRTTDRNDQFPAVELDIGLSKTEHRQVDILTFATKGTE